MVINHLHIGMILQVRPPNLPSLKTLYHPLLMHLSNWREKKTTSFPFPRYPGKYWGECFFFSCVLGVQSYLLRRLRMYRDFIGENWGPFSGRRSTWRSNHSTAQLLQAFHLETQFAIYNRLQCQVPVSFCQPASYCQPQPTHMLNRSLFILHTHHHDWT